MLHNIPEGMATYVASYHSVSSGLPLAVAIAIHNVPEGLAVRYLVITPPSPPARYPNHLPCPQPIAPNPVGHAPPLTLHTLSPALLSQPHPAP